MKNPLILGTLRKVLILLSCTVVLALLSATQIASAQVPGNVHEKAPKRVIEALAAGSPQDLIVVFDDKVAQRSAAGLQSMTALPSHDSRVIELKAARYTEKKQAVLSAFGSHEVSEIKHYSHLPVGFLRIHSKEALDKLLANPDVVGVYEDTKEQKFLAESLPLINQPQAAAQGYLGTGTAVAVLDTGVDYRQPAFGSCTSPGVPANCKVVYAQDFTTSDDGKLDDEEGHGTNVAGIVIGVAPGTNIIALDVFGSDGRANSTDIYAAINWCIAYKSTYNIVAVNLSLGGSKKYSSQTTESPYYAAFAGARDARILPIVASGNDGYNDGLASPAAVQGAISVGAVYDSSMGPITWGDPANPLSYRCSDSTSADKVACNSNSASFLTLLAPGAMITAAGITKSGTSMAAPHVAGAVAVLRAAYPNETLDQTVARLTNGVMVTDSKVDITKPRLNLQMALGVNASCTYSLSETSKSFSSISSIGGVAVTTSAGCTWNAASTTGNSDWITVTSGSSGSGNGTVNYSVSANTNIASRIGTITVAGQTYTVTQSGSVGAVSNILLNPGFEDGPVSWTDSTANKLPVITTYLNPTTTNSWYAWLCGYNNCVDKLYQDVTVPADAQSAYVQFNYWIATQETASFIPFDKMTVSINGLRYWTLSNLNATTGWVPSPQIDISAFKGQTIRLQFSATTDSSFATDFFVDDVALMVSGSTPDTQAPTVPIGLTATAISTSAINLAWDASTDNVEVTAYKLYRDGALVKILGNVTAYRDTDLTASTSYKYTVSGCDRAGNCSEKSIGATASTPSLLSDTQPPAVPTGLKATVISSSTINLTWTASTDDVGVDTYKVYRNGALFKVLGKVTSYSDIELTPSTPYSYTVSACDAAGNCSAQSSAVLATTDPPSPWSSVVFSGPSTYQVTGNTVNITISKITNNSLWRYSGSLRLELWALSAPYYSGASATGYNTASTRTYLINGLTDYLDAGYYFSNIALNLPFTAPPTGYSNYTLFLLEYDPANCSAADYFCTIDYMNYHETQPPTVPTGLSSTATGSSQISLSWTASTDNVGMVTTYKVYRNGILVTLLGNVTSYIDVGLAASTLYSYAISACDAWGYCSVQSIAASATTAAPPDTQPPTIPTGLTATPVTSSRIDLSWNASTDNIEVTAYNVYSGGKLVATLGNVTSSSRTNAPSTPYVYTVSACDAAGNCSAQSAPASATTPAPPDSQPPTIPAGLTASAVSNSQIDLSWNASTDNIGVTAYKIYSSDGQTVTLGNVTTYNHTGLRILTTYSYTVAACDAAENCSAQSASATATTDITLIAPTLSSPIDGATGQTTSVAVTWLDTNTSPQESSYKVRIKPDGGSYTEYSTVQNTTSYSMPGLAAGTKYYWSVKAVGNGTSTLDSAYPTDRSFAVTLLGDINDDGIVTIADAILACRVMSGMPTTGQTIASSADVNADNKIGLAEVLYILQKVAGVR